MQYDFKQVEEKWKNFWFENEIYKVSENSEKPKYYCLDTWAYPSADGVTAGYIKSFGGMDVQARYKRMKGFNVLYPTGWDTLGLPAENYAIKMKMHPREVTDKSIKHFKEQFKAFGLSTDWSRELNTADPEYYKWTQWVFLVMYEKGLAYRREAPINWCPQDMTVLAKEQVIDGKCERCGTEVEEKNLMQWYFKITDYAQRLYEDCSKLNWEEKYLNPHKQWIKPEHLRDWCVSRQRYWGPPIPIVYCGICGDVPLPLENLPVVLPKDVDFTPTGESPLAKNAEFINTKCPKCGRDAKRETDTLDTFVSSGWYEYRFMDPFNTGEFASKEKTDYWGFVDHYQGTAEHLTAHLVYVRFITKVLFDAGLVSYDEPFPKYTPVGLMVDKSGTKFSKRLGNAPNTDALMEKYGGDIMRLTCQFIGPFDDISKWNEDDTVALMRFRDRILRIAEEKVDGKSYEMPEEITKALHRMVKEVEENIEAMKYNVCISKMMVFVGLLNNYEEKKIDRGVWEGFIKVLAPFAPFITEELWSNLGNSDSVHMQSWFESNSKLLESNNVEIVVQIDGKYKGIILVEKNSTQDYVETEAKVFLGNKTPLSYKIVYVEGKLLNFVNI